VTEINLYEGNAKYLSRDVQDYKSFESTSTRKGDYSSVMMPSYAETTTNANSKAMSFMSPVPVKQFISGNKTPLANHRGDENAPTLSNSASNNKHRSVIEISQMKNDVASIKCELSYLRNDISNSSKSLKEIDQNMASPMPSTASHTYIKANVYQCPSIGSNERMMTSNSSSDLHFDRFYKSAGKKMRVNHKSQHEAQNLVKTDREGYYGYGEGSLNKENGEFGVRNDQNWSYLVNTRPDYCKQ